MRSNAFVHRGGRTGIAARVIEFILSEKNEECLTN